MAERWRIRENRRRGLNLSRCFLPLLLSVGIRKGLLFLPSSSIYVSARSAPLWDKEQKEHRVFSIPVCNPRGISIFPNEGVSQLNVSSPSPISRIKKRNNRNVAFPASNKQALRGRRVREEKGGENEGRDISTTAQGVA